jgi:DNA-binding response OmpR family regulator
MPDELFSVLMIEDNEADARYIELLLLESMTTEFDLQVVGSLADASAKLDERDFQVILSDLGLKDSSGLETLARVRAAAPDIPTIVLTGHGDDEVGIQAMRNGAQDYLVKGEVDGNLLIKTIRFAYERHQAERNARESEARERVVSEQVPAILWTTDTQLRFTSSRGRGLVDLSLKPDELIGVALSEYFETDDPEFLPIKLHVAALAGDPGSDMVKWQERYYQMHVEPVRNEHDEITGTIGVAVDVTQQHNLELSIEAAQRIQQHLLPSSAPTCTGFEIAGACFPAEQCSGDYYDFMPMPDKQLSIVVADAAGHGFGPALLAATVRSYLRVAAMQGKDVHEMLAIANWLLTGDSAPDQFVTLFCCLLDPKEQTFKFTSAGHQAYLIDAYGVVSTLDSPSLPIGIDQQEVFSSSPPIKAREGDVIVICTDGVVEAESPGGEHYGLRRAIHRVRKYRNRPAEEIIDALYRSIIKFSHPVSQKDDITVVIVKVLADPNADTGSVPEDHEQQARDR